jgi:hypothetical protein
MKETSIDYVIKALEEEKRRGATTVRYRGTLVVVTKNSGTIILTTEPQW